jgi:hypothetical protein
VTAGAVAGGWAKAGAAASSARTAQAVFSIEGDPQWLAHAATRKLCAQVKLWKGAGSTAV